MIESMLRDCTLPPLGNGGVGGGTGTPLSVVLLTMSAMLLATTLSCASAWRAQPLSDLGLRSQGSVVVVGVGGSIRGYDAVLGAMSPTLRLQCHLAAGLALWGATLYLLDAFFAGGRGNDDDYDSDGRCRIGTLVASGVVFLFLYASVLFVVFPRLLPGVSTPGGPRPHKIRRQPQWSSGLRTPAAPTHGWRCLGGDKAHRATARKFAGNFGSGGSAVTLTGEPAGRMAWFKEGADDETSRSGSSSGNNDGGGGGPVGFVMGLLSSRTGGSSSGDRGGVVDEELVQRLALGGRDEAGFDPSKNPNSNDQIFRAQQIRAYLLRGDDGHRAAPPDLASRPSTVQEACRKAAHFYSMLQCDDGHWAADYGGPHFLMPGLVTAWYVMGRPSQLLDDDQVTLLKHYILVHQQEDGGWGTHIESPSTMFGSTLMYVALRLLGADAADPACVGGRRFLHEHGGALYTSSWAKFYLCLLGLMDWKGHNSVPPEMWLLPNWFPFHPGRMWCHARMVYLPMGYLYGCRFVYEHAESDPLILALRKEIYVANVDGDYTTIPWGKTRHWIADTDNYSPIPAVMKAVQNVLARYEEWPAIRPFRDYVRRRGMAFSIEYMEAEDLQTNYIDIGPVNKVLNLISRWAIDRNLDDPKIVSHMQRAQDYLWVAEDGMKMQGYNGSQCWDTSFCAQALFEADMLDEFPEMTRKVWSYLERTQILSTPTSQASPAYRYESNEYRLKFYRHVSEGGWPFSTSAHGWPISDCTGEGLKAVLCLLKTRTVQEALERGAAATAAIADEAASDEEDTVKVASAAAAAAPPGPLLLPISHERLYKAVNVLLTYQNEDGGWATYENTRGWGWYEQLNPSEVFGDIMIDYSYVECSMAVMTALIDFAELVPDHRPADIQDSIDKGRAFLKSIQRADGSWYGSWACCFCYGTWFGVEGLVKCGEPLDSPSITKACAFLLRQQRPNGGWGEDFTSCYDKDYAQDGMKAYGDDGSGVVNTAWALLALSMAKCPDVDAIRRGVRYLMKRQLPSGDWPQEGIAGVFNRSVGITYTAYRNVFPIWAMGRSRRVYGDALDKADD